MSAFAVAKTQGSEVRHGLLTGACLGKASQLPAAVTSFLLNAYTAWETSHNTLCLLWAAAGFIAKHEATGLILFEEYTSQYGRPGPGAHCGQYFTT